MQGMLLGIVIWALGGEKDTSVEVDSRKTCTYSQTWRQSDSVVHNAKPAELADKPCAAKSRLQTTGAQRNLGQADG